MKTKLVLIIIIFLASLLRLWNLNNFPVGFNADEASLGYNAYSLFQTGKDEYGTPWPISFKSFGDFKPGLYVYLTMPFVAIIGLNEWAVRLPSALLGIGTVILVFFLSLEFFKNRSIALLSSFLLSITPWHIHFSRGAWETNVATFFITLGILFFLKDLKFLFWSLLFFLFSMYTYQSPRLLVPILLLILVIFNWKEIKLGIKKSAVKKNLVMVGMILFLVILSLPLLLQLTNSSATSRFSGLTFFNDQGPISRINQLRGEHQNPGSLAARLIHNKATTYTLSFLSHYLDHFDPTFLFLRGDSIIRNKVPETGQFYLAQFIFLIAGIIGLILNKKGKLLLAWILIAPLASATTYQTPHALRALSMVVPLSMVMGYGGWYLFNLFKNKRIKTAVFMVITVLLIFEITHYLESYFVHYPKRYPLAWEYGFREMVTKLTSYQQNYDKIIITDRYDQPYALVLFYTKYDPKKYQPQAFLSERDKFNFGTVRSFDKFEFYYIKPEDIKREGKVLFVGTKDEVPAGVKVLDKVYFPNKEEAFIFFER